MWHAIEMINLSQTVPNQCIFLYQKQDQEGPKVIPEETELNSSKTTVSAGTEETAVPSVPPTAPTTAPSAPTVTAAVPSTPQPNGNGKGVPEENP